MPRSYRGLLLNNGWHMCGGVCAGGEVVVVVMMVIVVEVVMIVEVQQAIGAMRRR